MHNRKKKTSKTFKEALRPTLISLHWPHKTKRREEEKDGEKVRKQKEKYQER